MTTPHHLRRIVGSSLLALALVAAGGASGLTADAAPTTGTIGNRAFIDVNANGRQDAGEPGLAGVRVTIYGPSGNPQVTGLTDSAGWWGVRTLSTERCYQLAYEIPGGYIAAPTLPPVAPTSTVNSNTIGSTGRVAQTICPTSTPQNQWDAGFVVRSGAVTKGKIGDRVLLDTNGNGRIDSADTGIADVPIRVSDTAGKPLVVGKTAAGGWYGVGNLDPTRCYRVAITIPPGLRNANSTVAPDGQFVDSVCPREPQLHLTDVDFLLARVDANPGGKAGNWWGTEGSAEYVEATASAKWGSNGQSSGRIDVALNAAFIHRADGTVVDVRGECCGRLDLSLTAPAGVYQVVPGRYVVTPSRVDSDGYVGTDTQGCSAKMTWDVSQITLALDQTVSTLVADVRTACANEPARIVQLRIAPGAAQTRPDRDGDGVSDSFDNCLAVSNANQADADLDGIGDACDPQQLRRRLTGTSSAGEEILQGASFVATPDRADVFLGNAAASPQIGLVDASGRALKDFQVAMYGVVAEGGRPDVGPQRPVAMMVFRTGQQVVGSRTGSGAAVPGAVYVELPHASTRYCPGGRTESFFVTAGAGTTATVNVTEMAFEDDVIISRIKRLRATITQRCTPSSPPVTMDLVYDLPL